jgi:hypothetical protein
MGNESIILWIAVLFVGWGASKLLSDRFYLQLKVHHLWLRFFMFFLILGVHVIGIVVYKSVSA